MTAQIDSRAFIGLGGNLGDPRTAFAAARRQLAEHPQVELLASSPLYRTPPLGGPSGQPDYLNAVLKIRTSLPPETLLELCQHLEAAGGRSRDIHWGPRTLDIDLLLYGDRVLATAQLQLPHPRLHERHFVLLPLCDLAPQLMHPSLGQTLSQLLAALPPAAGINIVAETW